MEFWQDSMVKLMSLKPHKRRNFQRGIEALSQIQQTF